MRLPIRLPVWRTVIVLIAIAFFHAGCTQKAKVERALSRGAKHFEAGEYDKARIEYMRALQLGEKDTTTIRQLALTWLKQGAPMKAVPFLLEAKKANPADLEIRAHLPAVMLALGDADSARAEALEILKLDPANEPVLLVLVDSSRTPEELLEAKELLTRPPASQTAAGQAALAVLHLKEKHLAEATRAVDEALKIDGNSAAAYVAKAGVNVMLKDLAEAEESFRKARDLAPARSVTRLKYAEFLTQRRDLDAALAETEKLSKDAHDYLPALLLQVRLTTMKGDHDRALALLPAIFSRDINNYDALVLESNIRLAKGDAEKAVEVLERLTAAYPKVPTPYVLLAQAQLRAKNPAKAIAVLEKALAARPQFPEAMIMLGELNLRFGKAPAAADHFRNALTLVPNNPAAKLLLAQSYLAIGRLDEARQLTEELRTALPKWDQPALVLGLVFLQQGKADEARVSLEAAAELEPNNLNAVGYLIELALSQKDLPSAEARAVNLCERAPNSAAANFLLGRVHAAKGEWDKSENALRKTLELDPHFSPAYNLLSSTLASNNRLTEALGQMEGVLSKTPDNASALMLTALVRSKMKDYGSARETYERLIAAAPEFPPALNNLAWLYVEHFNEPAKGYELAVKARALNPTDPLIADTLGWALFKRGEYQSALTLFQESARMLSAIPDLQYHLGMAHYMMGNSDAARAAFEKAVQSPDEFGGKVEAQRHLAMLKHTKAAGDSQSAVALKAAVDANPKDVVALSNLASFHESAGDPKQAAVLYQQVLEINPNFGAAARRLARLYAGPLGDLAAALKWAKKARQLSPSDAESTAVLGQVALATGDAAWAHGLLKEGARQLPTDYRLHADFGWAAYRIGRLDEAKSVMEQVAAAAPESEVGAEAKRFLHFIALTESSDTDGAVTRAAEELLSKNGGFLPALFIKAKFELKQESTGATSTLMEEILKANPDFTPAQKELAIFYARNDRDIARAYELGTKARRTLSQDSELNRAMAYACYKRKEYRLTVQILEPADLSGLTPDDLFVLGMAQAELKESEKSRQNLGKALKAGLGGTKAVEANKVLALEPSGP